MRGCIGMCIAHQVLRQVQARELQNAMLHIPDEPNQANGQQYVQ